MVLDDKVERARYGFIVSRKEYYDKLIKEMEGFSMTLSHKVEQSTNIFDEVINVDIDKTLIYDQLYSLVEGTIRVDG